MIIRDDTMLYTAIKNIEYAEQVAVDVEATGLNVRKEKVIGIGFAVDDKMSFYLPLHTYNHSMQKLIPDFGADKFDQLLSALKEKKLIFHNASYDVRIIKNDLGVDLQQSIYADTMLMKHTVDEIPPFGLKQIAKSLYGIDATEEQKVMKESVQKNGGSTTKKNYEMYKADLEPLAKYCEQDCKLTFKLFNHYGQMLKQENLEKFFYEDEVMPLYREVTITMEDRGIPVDVPKITKAKAEISVEMEKLEISIQRSLEPLVQPMKQNILMKLYGTKTKFKEFLAELHGLDLPRTVSGKLSFAKAALKSLPESKYKSFLLGEGTLSEEEILDIQDQLHKRESGTSYFVNIQSRDQLRNLFFKILKEKSLKVTDYFLPIVDEEFLKSISHKYDFINDLILYNKLLKLRSTYMDRFLEQHEDGIFYPYFKQHGTTSGRYSGDIQQLPRPIPVEDMAKYNPLEYKFRNLIRAFFIAGEDYKFIDDDYESLEPHCFADASGSEWIRDIFRNGHDLYSEVGIGAYKIENASADKKADNYLKKVNPKARQDSKVFALGIPYGMESFKLSKTLDIGQNAAQKIIDNYLNSAENEDGTGLRHYMNQCDAQAMKEGKVFSKLGRVRHLPKAKEISEKYGADILNSLLLWKTYNHDKPLYDEMKKLRRQLKNALNNAKNFPIQSLAASIVNRAAIAITRQVKNIDSRIYVCAQIHDQLVIRCPEEHIDKVRKIVQTCMEDTTKLSISLKAVPQIADNFLEGH